MPTWQGDMSCSVSFCFVLFCFARSSQWCLFFEALICCAFPLLFLLEVLHSVACEGPAINCPATLPKSEIKCRKRQPRLNNGGGVLECLSCRTGLNWVRWYRPSVWQGTLSHIDALASCQLPRCVLQFLLWFSTSRTHKILLSSCSVLWVISCKSQGNKNCE